MSISAPSWIVEPSSILHSMDRDKSTYPTEWLHVLDECGIVLNALGYLLARNGYFCEMLETWYRYVCWAVFDPAELQRVVTYEVRAALSRFRNAVYWWNVQNTKDKMVEAIGKAEQLFGLV